MKYIYYCYYLLSLDKLTPKKKVSKRVMIYKRLMPNSLCKLCPNKFDCNLSVFVEIAIQFFLIKICSMSHNMN